MQICLYSCYKQCESISISLPEIGLFILGMPHQNQPRSYFEYDLHQILEKHLSFPFIPIQTEGRYE